MEVIISHNNLDFDGLAAMVAAKCLHPKAKLGLSGRMNENVRLFVSLHKDVLSAEHAGDFKLSLIQKMIIVDTKMPERIGKFRECLNNPGLELVVYDHHPQLAGSLNGSQVITELVGAVTTLLVEMLQHQAIPVSPLEATLFALGIYEDTGCLLYPGTTVRDVQAVAYLLSQGANLELVSDFIDRPLNGAQKEVFNELLQNAVHKRVKGIDILIAQTEMADFVQGLGYLTYRLTEIEDAEVYLIAAKMGDRIHLVGRSRLDSVDMLAILQCFGGGGYARAASATVKVKEMALPELMQKLDMILAERVKPAPVAAQIMSSPVKTIPPDATLDETYHVLLRNGHTGLPVVQDGKLVGIISRRDVDKARHHNLGHAPVRAYMSHQVITIPPDLPLAEVQQLMVEKDVGRLPVVQDNLLLGIVTRTDVLRTWHGETYAHPHHFTFNQHSKHSPNLAGRLEAKLPAEVYALLKQASAVAESHQINLFVVGGFVRDFILNRTCIDVDLVVEGDGLQFAELLAAALGGTIHPHPEFGTATLLLPDGKKVDIATARQEFYEYPAALPQVEYGSVTLQQDLYRRDFTINTMAIDLGETRFGRLVDFFGGLADLRHGIIRVLYNLSFIEDPTRIFRAIKYEQRYAFTIEPETRGFMEQAREAGVLQELSAERLREELIILLNEAAPWRIIKRLAELRFLDFFCPGLTPDEGIWAGLQKIERMQQWFREKAQEYGVDLWQVILLVLTHRLSETACHACIAQLNLSQLMAEKMRIMGENVTECLALLNQLGEVTPSVIYRRLRTLPLAVDFALLALTREPRAEARLLTYLAYTRSKEPGLTGHDLKAMGYQPGPLFKEVLEELTAAKLDGKIQTRQAEISFVREYMTRKVGEQGGNE